MIKILRVSLICVLTIYAPLELSRLILLLTPFPTSVIELVFMWVCYVAAIGLVTKMVRGKDAQGTT